MSGFSMVVGGSGRWSPAGIGRGQSEGGAQGAGELRACNGGSGPLPPRGGPRMGQCGPWRSGGTREATWRAGVGCRAPGGDVSRPDWSRTRRRRRQVAEVEWGGAESEEEGGWLRQEVGEGV